MQKKDPTKTEQSQVITRMTLTLALLLFACAGEALDSDGVDEPGSVCEAYLRMEKVDGASTSWNGTTLVYHAEPYPFVSVVRSGEAVEFLPLRRLTSCAERGDSTPAKAREVVPDRHRFSG